jgi:hypothetical protein
MRISKPLVVSWLVLILACGWIASCAATKKNSPYKQSYKFHPCGRVKTTMPQEHALAATILALKETEGTEQWKYVRIFPEKHKVRAKNCVLDSKTDCTMLSFVVTKSGIVRVNQMPGKPVPAEMWDDLHRWMQKFSKGYRRFSCYEDDALRSAVKPYGYEF